MADAQIFAPTACFNRDVSGFFTKWMRDVEDAQAADGTFYDVAPRVVLDTEGAPGWGDAGVIVQWTVLRCTGDARIAEEHYDAMKKWVEHIRRENPDLRWTKKRGNDYGDWVSVNAQTPNEVLATAYFAQSARLVGRMAKALGREEDAKAYEALFQRIKAAFDESYVTPDARVKGDTQTSYLLALANDLLPKEQRAAATDHLLEQLKAHDWHLTTGFLGVRHLLPVLTDTGHVDVAYRLLETETFPSWLYPVEHGATTIWERWDGYTVDKGFQDPGMNSFNHYAMGSVGEWLYETVGGIRLDDAHPGYKHFVVAPKPGGSITSARAEHRSAYGTIVSDWRVAGGEVILDVTVPVNTSASVCVPAGDACIAHEVGSGQYEFHGRP
jgi:alpha-L-rhamnosidase